MEKQLTEKQEAINALKKLGVKPGTTIYTLVKKVSSSGMTRHIQPFIVRKGKIVPIGWFVARATGFTLVSGTHAIKVTRLWHGYGLPLGLLAREGYVPKGV